MKISRTNHALWGLAPFSPKVQQLAKIIPGLVWDRDASAYVAYRDAMKLTLVSLGSPVDGQDEFEQTANGSLVHVGKANEKLIRGYQKEGVEFLLRRGPEGCVLADDFGLGKTCQALTAAKIVNRKTLVVCPNYVRGVWKKEIEKWWPKAVKNIAYPRGVKACTSAELGCSAGSPLVVVIHYDILHAWADAIVEWGPEFVVFDEAHLIGHEKSQRAQACRAVVSSSRYRVALTGTPMTSRPRDLWNLVDVVSPGRFGKFFPYGMRYCNGHTEQVTPEKVVYKFDGKSHEDELHDRLSYFMLRRLKSDVAMELPPKTRQIINVEVSGVKTFAGNADSVNMRRYLDGAADAKLPQTWEIVKNHLEEGHRVVVFTWRRRVAEWFRDQCALMGHDVRLIHGGISAQRRGQAIETAKAQEAGLLVATLDSASVGIDLSFADVGVFAEIDYKPHALLQAEARLHRFGQVNPTLIQYIIANGTLDEVVASIVIGKLDTFESVVGPTGEKLGADLRGTEDDVMAKLASAIGAML